MEPIPRGPAMHNWWMRSPAAPRPAGFRLRGIRPVYRLGLMLAALPLAAAPAPPASVRIANGAIALEIDRQGAVITALRRIGDPVNWYADSAQEDGSPRFGQFLCFDRWGPVTPAEEASGIPFHGEAGVVPWRWTSRADRMVAQRVTLPVSGLQAARRVELVGDAGVFHLVNVFTNPTAEMRDYNAVEHPLLSPKWLGDDTTLRTNATHGRLTNRGEPVPDSGFAWPFARFEGRTWDLRGRVLMGDSVAASLVFPDGAEWAWACLENLRTHEVFGFVWRTADYPWLNLWWSAVDGAVLNRSMEPGTTGLHQPLPRLREVGTELNRPVLCTLAPGESRRREVWGFALRLPAEGGAVVDVTADGRELRLRRESGAVFVRPMR